MKKFFLLLTALLVLNPVLKAEEMATMRFMWPDNMAKMFAAVFTSKVPAYEGYVTVNNECICRIHTGQYTDIKMAPDTYDFVVYTNVTPSGSCLEKCTFEKAKAQGAYFTYNDIKMEAGQTYFIDLSKSKRKLSNEKAFNKAVAAYKIKEAKNEINRSFTTNQALAANSSDTPKAQKPAGKNSKVDQNIPSSGTSNDDTYVLIIANEHYQELSPVTYAANDGLIFKDYCTKTLGIPETQVRYYPDASYGKMVGAVDWLKYALDNFSGAKAIVYYCGHGIPDEKTGQAYLIPVDGKGTNMKTCYSLQDLYKSLAATKAQSITYFMDACFTGATKEGSMLVAARGVARAPEKETLSGKTIVFSASSGDETAMTLDKEGHGLFTYYLLKKLQESEGNVTYGDLADYLHQHVKKDAFLINEKPQTPVVATSPAVVSTWKQMKLK